MGKFLIRESPKSYRKSIIQMDLILFGAGHYGRDAFSFFGGKNIFCFCDNRVKGEDEEKLCGKKVISFERFIEICQEYIVVVCIKLELCLEVCKQLERVGVKGYVVFEAFKNDTPDKLIERLQDGEEREKIQRSSYLFLLDKLMIQFKYLQRHIDIRKLTPATGELRKRQLQLLDYAKEFFSFIEELYTKPFLTFSNLIGAVRYQGFVPWDDDLDFGLMRSEYEKLLEFAYKKCAVLTFEQKKDIWMEIWLRAICFAKNIQTNIFLIYIRILFRLSNVFF